MTVDYRDRSGRNVGSAILVICGAVAIGALVQCGGGGPTQQSSVTTTLAPATTTTTAPAGIVLPAGMVCSPTPPPLWGMQLKIHGGDQPGRFILDSKPIVANIDSYCQRVMGTSGIFCETRVEGDPQRQACDYLAVGQATNGRWGPTWYLNNVPCGTNITTCADHPTEQFMVVAKATGRYEACASDKARVATDATRCGFIDITSLNP